jgi:hypothetical protein
MYTLRHWHRFKVPEAVNMLWALAVLRGCTPETWASLLDKLDAVPLDNIDDVDLHKLYLTFMLLEAASKPAFASLQKPTHPYTLLCELTCEFVSKVNIARAAVSTSGTVFGTSALAARICRIFCVLNLWKFL